MLAILRTGFGKSLIYQVFEYGPNICERERPRYFSTQQLVSIVEEQAKEMNGLGIRSVHLKPDIEDCLPDISDGHFRMIFASADKPTTFLAGDRAIRLKRSIAIGECSTPKKRIEDFSEEIEEFR